MDEITKIIGMLSVLGDKALTAFIIYCILHTLEWMVFFALGTWGLRALWKGWKKYEWRDED
jgi:hypothetical protein